MCGACGGHSLLVRFRDKELAKTFEGGKDKLREIKDALKKVRVVVTMVLMRLMMMVTFRGGLVEG